jgi:hypothetical protein
MKNCTKDLLPKATCLGEEKGATVAGLRAGKL